jgi:phospholipid-binding lipoprotein MlaA
MSEFAGLRFKGLRWLSAGLLAALLAGCASGPTASARDPLEPMNRKISSFNEGLDAVLLKPVATAYKSVTPSMVRTGVSNFFGNLGDVWSAFNSMAQLKVANAADNGFRVGVNTFFGLGGVLDVASEMNIERHKEDFGQTLGRWGVPAGPYLVLPVFGPSTVRDASAFTIDTRANPVRHVDHDLTRNSLYALRLVETRANLLRAGNVLDEAALDKYSFTRDVYLQLRRAQITNGNESESEDDNPEKQP